jgi:hypothetical protein
MQGGRYSGNCVGFSLSLRDCVSSKFADLRARVAKPKLPDRGYLFPVIVTHFPCSEIGRGGQIRLDAPNCGR